MRSLRIRETAGSLASVVASLASVAGSPSMTRTLVSQYVVALSPWIFATTAMAARWDVPAVEVRASMTACPRLPRSLTLAAGFRSAWALNSTNMRFVVSSREIALELGLDGRGPARAPGLCVPAPADAATPATWVMSSTAAMTAARIHDGVP